MFCCHVTVKSHLKFFSASYSCHLCNQCAGEDEEQTFVTGKEGGSENDRW